MRADLSETWLWVDQTIQSPRSVSGMRRLARGVHVRAVTTLTHTSGGTAESTGTSIRVGPLPVHAAVRASRTCAAVVATSPVAP